MLVAERPRQRLNLDPKAVGAAIRAIREERGMVQEEVAARLGLSKSGYGHYETGRTPISLDDLPRFADALKIAPDEFAARLGLIQDQLGESIRRVEVITRGVRESDEIPDHLRRAILELLELTEQINRERRGD